MDNNNQHIATCKNTFVNIANSALKICKEYEKFSPELKTMSSKFEHNLNDRLNDFNPKIMIYGIYNAGKSTIMNALMGENKARMSDIPTTYSIDEYKWNEYTIYDTPGINAPKKDEEVSKAQLEKSDVIIFVMDTEGAFNLGKNYRELLDIVKKGKRLLIVLNNKSGYDLSEEKGRDEIEKIKNEIYNAFAELYNQIYPSDRTSPEELAKKFKIIVVDAKTALEARTDKNLDIDAKKLLLDNSNIFALEDAIMDEYSNTSGYTILHQLEIELTKNLDNLSDILKNLATDSVSAMSKNALTEIQDIQEGLINKISEYARGEAEDLETEIYHSLVNSKDEQQAKQSIETSTTDWASRINKYAEEQIKRNSARIGNVLTDYSNFMKVNVGEINFTADNSEPLNFNQDFSTISNIETGKNKFEETTKESITGFAIQEGLKKALPLVTKLPWIGPAIGKVLGPLIPGIGPIIMVASVLTSLFGKSDEEKRYEAELERAKMIERQERARQAEIARRKQEVKEEAKRISKKLYKGIVDQIQNLINTCFEPTYNKIQESISAHKKESANAISHLREIDTLKQKLKNDVAAFCS